MKSASASGVRAVVLVGFMGAGKAAWARPWAAIWAGLSKIWMSAFRLGNNGPSSKFFGSRVRLNFASWSTRRCARWWVKWALLPRS